MRRLAALGLTAAALAFPAAGSASADAICTPEAAGTAACVGFECVDHHCIQKSPTAVYTTCRHPFTALCVYVPISPR